MMPGWRPWRRKSVNRLLRSFRRRALPEDSKGVGLGTSGTDLGPLGLPKVPINYPKSEMGLLVLYCCNKLQLLTILVGIFVGIHKNRHFSNCSPKQHRSRFYKQCNAKGPPYRFIYQHHHHHHLFCFKNPATRKNLPR